MDSLSSFSHIVTLRATIQPLISDSQGSVLIVAGHFNVLEAEGYLGRNLGSEQMDTDVPVAEVMIAAKRTAPKKQIYHWDIGGSGMQ